MRHRNDTISTHAEAGIQIVESVGSLEERLAIGGMDVSLRLVPPVRGESPSERFPN